MNLNLIKLLSISWLAIFHYYHPIEYSLETNVVLALQDTITSATKNDNAIYTSESVEKVPEFRGGVRAFYSFLAKNVRYPATARQNGTQGRVIVQFVVEKSGALTDVRVLRGIGDGCDEEAVRVLQTSPNWLPGVQSGRVVRVRFTVQVSFKLAD